MKYDFKNNDNVGIDVAPLVGARIEISLFNVDYSTVASLPSWERGLKSNNHERLSDIERRSPRGSED